MRIVILDSEADVSRRAADIICHQIASLPQCVLGLATGGTPVGTYQELIRRHRAGEVSFAEVMTFNLDEYVGLPPSHRQSYRSFMQEQLFDHIDLPAEASFLPESSSDLESAGEAYESRIAKAGGIDLQLLGIGTDGHIAFNEPGSSLASRTRIKGLTQQTRQDNARFFTSLDEVPKLAVTMGIGTILDARQVLLLATGSKKAPVVRDFVEGPITSFVPASALQLHPRATVLLDEAAASELQRLSYYKEVEAMQTELEHSSSPNK